MPCPAIPALLAQTGGQRCDEPHEGGQRTDPAQRQQTLEMLAYTLARNLQEASVAAESDPTAPASRLDIPIDKSPQVQHV